MKIRNALLVLSFSVCTFSQNITNTLGTIGVFSIKDGSATGREVMKIIDETKEAGFYSVEFDGTKLASGIYFYRIVVDAGIQNFSRTLKIILVK